MNHFPTRQIAFALVVIAACFTIDSQAVVNAAEPESLEARKEYWQECLDGWSLVKQQASVMAADPWQSLLHFQADCTVHIIYDPEHRSAMTFKFLKGDKEVLSIDGNTKSVFGARNNLLFYVDYPPSSYDTIVTAYDLSNGTKLWKTKLETLKALVHSDGWIEVSLLVTPKNNALVIVGSVPSGTYLEVLDTKTGQTLAHRIISEKNVSKRED